MFAMTLAPGASDEPLDAESELAGRQADRRLRAAAKMLAALHAVDPRRAGLRDEPVISLEDELRRWVTLFESVDDDLKPGAAACAQRLGASIPKPAAPVICHGDFRLGNLLCQGGDVHAIIDWEIWSLGDRRVDLAWFLLNSDPAKPSAGRPDPGLPPPAALLAEYEAKAGPVADLDWFAALVRFKQAAAMAMIVKHGRRRPPLDPRKAALVAHIRPLLDAATAVLGR
jgi:aminoglycoside phosphotransferase (APT) family kinase protein